jgi:hypothetical protein
MLSFKIDPSAVNINRQNTEIAPEKPCGAGQVLQSHIVAMQDATPISIEEPIRCAPLISAF